MSYKKGEDRHQGILFPDCIDDYIGEDAPVRFFDAFVDKLDLSGLGFKRSEPEERGRPAYDPRDLLKLYIYGYFYQVRSSRRLARECRCNVELMWLLNKLTPDFRTIADFRKDNAKSLKKVFREFTRFCINMKVLCKSYISIDGSKFRAVNAKDRNLTLSKLDDRIKRLEEHIDLYLAELDSEDEEDSRKLSKEEVRRKLDVCRERKDRYEGYRRQLEESGESQLSLTDEDARLMKTSEGFGVGYNVQTAVDAESHIVTGYNVTNRPTDHGLITQTAMEVKEDYGTDVLECVADKGYEGNADHANALAGGIIPNVIRRDGGSSEEVTFDYRPVEISEQMRGSTKPEDIRVCLEAGVVPDAYEGILSNPRIVNGRSGSTGTSDEIVSRMTEEQMKELALDGNFVRDAERNLVYCPRGEILRQKSVTSGGNIRYCNRLACLGCPGKCTASKFKVVEFNKDTLVIGAHGRKSPMVRKVPGSGKREPARKVRYTLHLDTKKMDNRKCLSEHPFGTIKRTLGQYYFLLRGMTKVEGEMGLFCLSYNIRRVINMVGVTRMLEALV